MNLLNGIQNLESAPEAKKFLAIRKQAQSRLSELAWPSRHQENWKYTNLDFLKETIWKSGPFRAADAAVKEYQAYRSKVLKTFSFVNGDLLKESGQGFEAKPISTLPTEDLARAFPLSPNDEIFELLNASWGQEGLVINIPAGKSFKKPICLDFYFSSQAKNLASHPRVIVNLGKSAKATFLFRSFGKGTYFNNLVAKFKLAEASSLELINYQSNSEGSNSFSHVQVDLEKHANLKTMNLSLDGRLNREKLDIFHNGSHSSSQCYGIYLTSQSHQSDHYTNIEHRVGDCTSVQLYKGLLADESRAVFNGRVLISHGSAKADSAQLNNNLLLSSKAEIDSKPQLEILADDVKATHGSTVGQLDEDEIFYLQSRGIEKPQAIRLLAHGFAFEVLNQVTDRKLAAWLKSQLQKVLEEMTFT